MLYLLDQKLDEEIETPFIKPKAVKEDESSIFSDHKPATSSTKNILDITGSSKAAHAYTGKNVLITELEGWSKSK
jgi:hypothetical protein